MIDEDTTDARALLTRVIGDEPPMTLTSKTVLRKAHRNTAIQRSAAMAGVAAAVATVVGVTMLARSGTAPGQDIAAASAPATPMTNVLTELSPPCVAGTPGCLYTKDDRSNRLSRDLNATIGTVLPKGMVIHPDPMAVDAGQKEPFMFGQLAGQYVASAQTQDSAGIGTVSINVSRQSAPATCDAVNQPPADVPGLNVIRVPAFAGCTDHTLPDGTVAAVSTYASVPVEGRQVGRPKIVVDARKPDGTFLHLVSDTMVLLKATDPPGKPVTRQEPPLSGDDLLRLAQLPALKY
jgi:hypothetical protein